MVALEMQAKIKGPLFRDAESSLPCARPPLPAPPRLLGEAEDDESGVFPFAILAQPKIKITTRMIRTPLPTTKQDNQARKGRPCLSVLLAALVQIIIEQAATVK